MATKGGCPVERFFYLFFRAVLPRDAKDGARRVGGIPVYSSRQAVQFVYRHFQYFCGSTWVVQRGIQRPYTTVSFVNLWAPRNGFSCVRFRVVGQMGRANRFTILGDDRVLGLATVFRCTYFYRRFVSPIRPLYRVPTATLWGRSFLVQRTTGILHNGHISVRGVTSCHFYWGVYFIHGLASFRDAKMFLCDSLRGEYGGPLGVGSFWNWITSVS